MIACLLWILAADSSPAAYPSPVDLVLTRKGDRMVVVDQGRGSLLLLDVPAGKVLSSVSCGRRPAAVALLPDESAALVTATYSGEVHRIALSENRLEPVATVWAGHAPTGIAVAPDGRVAYVALAGDASVAVIDLGSHAVVDKIPVGRWPRYLAITSDGRRLAVGVNAEGGVAVVDLVARKRLFVEDFAGINLGHMQVSADDQFVYFPWIVYRRNPITQSNIKRGWVLASRLARVRLDQAARREAIALDPEGMAVGDPHGLAISPSGERIVVAASGTHELLVFRTKGLPLMDYGGPGDHIDRELLQDFERFFRIPLGGRPMGVRFAPDDKTAFVANYLQGSIQEVDLVARQVRRAIPLGESPEPTLARRGEAIFHDAKRSLDQWYSCHSCHYEGGGNAVVMDTRNDGSVFSFKTVPSLVHLSKTGPWTWHGWQKDLRAAMTKSLTETMLGPAPQPPDVDAVLAFLETLERPPSAGPANDAPLSPEALRGMEVFRGEKASCSRCHDGPYLTDGRIHDVKTGDPEDRYRGFNTPSLLGVGDRALYLHDGRARSLEELLRGPHRPSLVSQTEDLSPQELADLIAYLKTL